MKKKLVITVVSLAAVGLLVAVLAIFLRQEQIPDQETETSSTTQSTETEQFVIELDPNRAELPTRIDAERIEENMTIGEIYSIMGTPQRDVGAGTHVLEWDLDAGEILRVSFLKDYDLCQWYATLCVIE